MNCEGKSGGLVLLWRKEWDVDVKSFSPAHIDAFISTNGIIWRFTHFYGNPKRNQRKHSWELLNRLHDLFKFPWLVAGDFIEIIHLSEKLGGSDVYTRI